MTLAVAAALNPNKSNQNQTRLSCVARCRATTRETRLENFTRHWVKQFVGFPPIIYARLSYFVANSHSMSLPATAACVSLCWRESSTQVLARTLSREISLKLAARVVCLHSMSIRTRADFGQASSKKIGHWCTAADHFPNKSRPAPRLVNEGARCGGPDSQQALIGRRTYPIMMRAQG